MKLLSIYPKYSKCLFQPHIYLLIYKVMDWYKEEEPPVQLYNYLIIIRIRKCKTTLFTAEQHCKLDVQPKTNSCTLCKN